MSPSPSSCGSEGCGFKPRRPPHFPGRPGRPFRLGATRPGKRGARIESQPGSQPVAAIAPFPRGVGIQGPERCGPAPFGTNAGRVRYHRRIPGRPAGTMVTGWRIRRGVRRCWVKRGSRGPVLRALRAGPGLVRGRSEHLPRLPDLRFGLLRRLLEPRRRCLSEVRAVPAVQHDRPRADGHRARTRRRPGGPGNRPVRGPARRHRPRGGSGAPDPHVGGGTDRGRDAHVGGGAGGARRSAGRSPGTGRGRDTGPWQDPPTPARWTDRGRGVGRVDHRGGRGGRNLRRIPEPRVGAHRGTPAGPSIPG